ncbi:MAG: hypothetical protein KGI78_01600 [Patescibacteria group bacterium]|nr:hypothetical protein [Patescibacteria group bacterium]MDE1943944.1 hypothetical protein [Patescibacteria group bacterium]MDE1945023.1 hypothetical protein [Patescibacteria group bacterium]MDE2057529.1 hypothetical protein [Patescibacteria group bacterium]
MRGRLLMLCAGSCAFAAALAAASLSPPPRALAESASSSLASQLSAQDAEIAQLNAEIAQYEAEIQKAGANKATLQSALASLNLEKSKLEAQINLTQRQISQTHTKIAQLGASISSTADSIDTGQAGLAEDLRSLAESDNEPLVAAILSSDSLGAMWSDIDADITLQGSLRTHIATLRGQKQVLAASQGAAQAEQQTLTSQKEQLTSQQTSLTATAKQKQQLLAETSAQQSQYEKLLAAAKAELASFSTFAANATSKGILENQTSCDAWGCYYNQRDSQWGNRALDGTSYTMKSDGCLVTALAMVMTHYGYAGVTPLTIDSNPADFASYFPANLLVSNVPIGGAIVSRVAVGPSIKKMDAALATGNPLIVGIHAYGGTHYIVFVSGANGHYVMRDPYQPSAKDVPFTQYYQLSEIFSAAKVVLS